MLNHRQFGAPSDTPVNPLPRQLSIPGLSEQHLPAPNWTPPPQEQETDPTSGYKQSLMWDTPNPIHSRDSYTHQAQNSTAMYQAGTHEVESGTEFVPPWRVTSPQATVSEEKIAHQVEHANPLALQGDDPDMVAYPHPDTGEENYLLYDGNHRVNAAQRRGQLLMPAHVTRWVPGGQRRA